MILLVDNYDSFVFNLKRYLVRLGQEVVVVRNDQIDCNDAQLLQYAAMVISPGPQSPDQAGACLELIQRFHQRVPILGVCLGHQAIWQALGGRIVRAKTPMHGKSSKIEFTSSRLFKDVPNPFVAARYHSLVADQTATPAGLKVTAWSEDREIMAIEHEQFPLFGLQFHPESILTDCGYQLLCNFLEAAGIHIDGGLPSSDLLQPMSAVQSDEPQQSADSEDSGDSFAVLPGSGWR